MTEHVENVLSGAIAHIQQSKFLLSEVDDLRISKNVSGFRFPEGFGSFYCSDKALCYCGSGSRLSDKGL